VADSLLGEIGEDILAWYFLGFEFIYILWPWQFEFSISLSEHCTCLSLHLSRCQKDGRMVSPVPAPLGRVPLALCMFLFAVAVFVTAGSWAILVCRSSIEILCCILVSGITLFGLGNMHKSAADMLSR